MIEVNKFVIAFQYYDGMSEEYKKSDKPYKTVIGVLTKKDKGSIGIEGINVKDSNGKIHYFFGNFNYEVIEDYKELVKEIKKLKDGVK